MPGCHHVQRIPWHLRKRPCPVASLPENRCGRTHCRANHTDTARAERPLRGPPRRAVFGGCHYRRRRAVGAPRSEEHTSELQSLMRLSYAVFCLKKKKQHTRTEQ